MEILFTKNSQKELMSMDNSILLQFKSAIEKLNNNPIRKHLKFGIPSHVIKVNKQARIIYDFKNDKIIILHCFTSHQDYEQWYNSYK